jgi:hypothetical protein
MTTDANAPALLAAPLPLDTSPPLGAGARKLLSAIAQTLDLPPDDDRLAGRADVVIGVIRALERDHAARDDDAATLAALLGRNT